MQDGEKPVFLAHVHSFRAVAIVAVVATHTLYDLQWMEKDRLWAKLCVSIFQNGTVPFVFVAGFLFRHRLPRFTYKGYLLTKLKYVIVPYIVISLPYVVLQKARAFGIFASWYPRTFDSDVLHVAFAYLTGRQMPIPLWFIPMIAVFYVFAPMFVFIDRRPKWYALVAPLLILASFSHRPQNQTVLAQSLVYFLPVYLSGMAAAHYRETLLDWVGRFRWPLVLVCVACVAFEVAFRERTGAIESANMFSTERGVFDVNIYLKLIGSLVLLDALRGVGPRLTRVLAPAAEMSFGIFFVHYYFIYFAPELRFALGGAPWLGSVLSLFLYTTGVVVLSMLIVWLLQRLLGRRSRFLVGS